MCIRDRPNDTLQTSFKTLLREDYGALILQLENVPSPLIVDLMNESRSQVLRTSRPVSDTIITFPYLKAGKYTIRVTGDLNGNGFWDTGDIGPVSYTHLRAHETVLDLVCRLLLEKKKKKKTAKKNTKKINT